MPELIAKNVRIYKVPSRTLDSSEGQKAFISLRSDSYSYPTLLEGDPEFRKVFEALSGDSVFLDELYSISDIKIDHNDIPDIKKKLPESYEFTILSKEEYDELYKKIRDKFEKSERKQKNLRILQNEIGALRKQLGEQYLYQDDMIYLLQLTERGWVDYSEPNYDEKTSSLGILLLKRLNKLGLIKYKTFKDNRRPYYVKLTKKGTSLKEKLKKNGGSKD